MVHHRKSPSQAWRTFLDNHVTDLVSIDFFIVPTATFRVRYAFIVLRHDRRKIVHFNVAAHPSAQWSAQKIVEVFPFYTAPRYLLRDRDDTYGDAVQRRINSLAIEEVITAPRSPCQTPFVERMIGSIRRDCMGHVIVLNDRHLPRNLRAYISYHQACRTHLSLKKAPPEPRRVESPALGNVIAFPRIGDSIIVTDEWRHDGDNHDLGEMRLDLIFGRDRCHQLMRPGCVRAVAVKQRDNRAQMPGSSHSGGEIPIEIPLKRRLAGLLTS